MLVSTRGVDCPALSCARVGAPARPETGLRDCFSTYRVREYRNASNRCSPSPRRFRLSLAHPATHARLAHQLATVNPARETPRVSGIPRLAGGGSWAARGTLRRTAPIAKPIAKSIAKRAKRFRIEPVDRDGNSSSWILVHKLPLFLFASKSCASSSSVHGPSSTIP